MTRIVLVSGSLRRDSANTAVTTTIRGVLDRRPGRIRVSTLSPHRFPFYNQDLDDPCGVESVRAARELVGSADALIVSTPSYNGAMPGVLKNALDWLSRPWGASALTGLPVAVVSASPGPRGGVDAQPNLREVLLTCGAVLLDHPPVAIGNAGDLPVSADGFTDAATVAALEELVDAVLAQCGPPAEPLAAEPVDPGATAGERPVLAAVPVAAR